MKTFCACSLVIAAMVLWLVPVRGAEPVAFLTDVQGKLEVERDGKRLPVEGSCDAVYDGDVIHPGAEARAKLVFADGIFDLQPSGAYRVEKAAVQKVAAGGKAEEVPPATRGFGGGGEENANALVVPKELVATIVPGITRAKDDLPVYSPRNQVFSSEPMLLIGGELGAVYEATVLKDGKILGRTIQVVPRNLVPFSAFGAGKMEPDEMYTLRIQLNGKTVNDTANATFFLLDEDEAAGLAKKFSGLSVFVGANARAFFKANLLLRGGCHSEAICLAHQLVTCEPANPLYQNLYKLAAKGLGY